MLDDGEECDGGHMCKMCRCAQGSKMTFPESVDCTSRKLNLVHELPLTSLLGCIEMPGSECNGGLGCDLSTCACMRHLGFTPVPDKLCGVFDPCETNADCASCQNIDCTWFGGGVCQTPLRFVRKICKAFKYCLYELTLL